MLSVCRFDSHAQDGPYIVGTDGPEVKVIIPYINGEKIIDEIGVFNIDINDHYRFISRCVLDIDAEAGQEVTIEIKAIMPGLNKEDINIEVNDDMLTISGERKNELGERTFIRREREFSKFNKTVRLPYPVNSEKITAALKHGMLHISLERDQDAGPKKIKIQ